MEIDWNLVLQIGGVLIGLLYLWWEYHADPKMWFASIVMPAISTWLYFRKGLYADFGINIYYLVIAVYGYIAWTVRGKSGDSAKASKPSLPISHASWPILIGCAVATAVIWAAIWWILVRFTNSTVPVADAFTTALSIVAMWMLARKYVEQWLAWFIVDAVCVGLYIYKEIPFYAGLYGLYTIIAGFGYRKWVRQINRPAE